MSGVAGGKERVGVSNTSVCVVIVVVSSVAVATAVSNGVICVLLLLNLVEKCYGCQVRSERHNRYFACSQYKTFVPAIRFRFVDVD